MEDYRTPKDEMTYDALKTLIGAHLLNYVIYYIYDC